MHLGGSFSFPGMFPEIYSSSFNGTADIQCIVKPPIRDTLNKGQSLYKGHGPCPISHSANTFLPPKEDNLSTKDKWLGPKVSFT